MGKVTAYLAGLLGKEAGERSPVVWFDPESHYREALADLEGLLPEVTFLRYDDSFFALRFALEPFLSGADPEEVIVYVPLAREQCHGALVEATTLGVELFPGQHPRQRNTRLGLVAKHALTDLLGDTAEIERQVEAGKLTLRDLDSLAEKGAGGILSLILGRGQAKDMALAFLGSDTYDEEIRRRHCGEELTRLLQDRFAFTPEAGEALPRVRAAFARHVLTTDFLAGLDSVPDQLALVGTAREKAAADACVEVARAWRQRYDLSDGYRTQAALVERDLNLEAIDLTFEQLVRTDTFAACEKALQKMAAGRLAEQGSEETVNLARERKTGFWGLHDQAIRSGWDLLATAGEFLLAGDRIEKELGGADLAAQSLWRRYTEGDSPWCLFDTLYRHIERQWETMSGEEAEDLDFLLRRIDQRYMDVSSRMADAFLARLAAGGFTMDGVKKQVDVFAYHVAPALAEGKTAYVLADAFRFEMAREVADNLGQDFDVVLRAVTGTVPGVTEVGMGALLPNHASPALVVTGPGKLALQVDGNVLKDRKDRIRFLEDTVGAGLCHLEMHELLPKPRKNVRERIDQAGLILVNLQDVDRMGENEGPHLVRRYLDDRVADLARACRRLAALGVQKIIVSADHGYLFGEILTSYRKIDPPGGDTAALHRRFWLGHGGTADPSFLRFKVCDFGLESDLEMAVPRGTACFKVQGGNTAYFHGGLSLPELAVPVLVVGRSAPKAGFLSKDIEWSLIPGSKKITTRFFSVQICGRLTGMNLGLDLPRVRVEILEKGKSLSEPVTASYGFHAATREVELQLDDSGTVKPNSVALRLRSDPSSSKVSVCLVEASTGTELSRLMVEAALSM
ncbi:MAG: PglZ domain-containing protein [Peptococcaceae bacterium]|jgi:hypothetical protein|nr:PglZ domain-containing protein [Peptococcaceae bacterium]